MLKKPDHVQFIGGVMIAGFSGKITDIFEHRGTMYCTIQQDDCPEYVVPWIPLDLVILVE